MSTAGGSRAEKREKARRRVTEPHVGGDMKAVLTGPHAVRRTLGPGWGGRVSVLTDPVAALVVTAVVPHLDSRGKWRIAGEWEE